MYVLIKGKYAINHNLLVIQTDSAKLSFKRIR